MQILQSNSRLTNPFLKSQNRICQTFFLWLIKQRKLNKIIDWDRSNLYNTGDSPLRALPLRE